MHTDTSIGNSNDGSGDKGSDFDGIQAVRPFLPKSYSFLTISQDGASNVWIDHCQYKDGKIKYIQLNTNP